MNIKKTVKGKWLIENNDEVKEFSNVIDLATYCNIMGIEVKDSFLKRQYKHLFK